MVLIGVALPLALVVIGLLRSAPLRGRLIADAVLLLLFSAIFAVEGQTPFLFGSNTPKNGIWDQLLAVGWWLLAARLAAAMVQFMLGFDGRSRGTRLLSDLLAGTSYVAALLVILNFVLRIPLAGLLATSGIVAIVLGLALQSTLSDLFSGVAVGVEQPFRAGDRIRLGESLEGVVTQINWRSIRIQTDEDDIAIVPNSTVAKSAIVNRSRPSTRRAAKVEFTCPAWAPLARIEAAAHDAVQLCPLLLDHPAPSIALTRLGERTHGYSIGFFVADSAQLGRARDMVLRAVHRQLRHARLLADAKGEEPGLLRSIAVFEPLGEDQLAALERCVRVRRLAPGETLFTQGEADSNLYMIESGVIEISREIDGSRQTAGRIGAGEYIGEIGLLTGEPRPVTATARTEALVGMLSRDAIAPLIAAEPALAVAFEASVRRGRALLDRDSAARAMANPQDEHDLLHRIRSFFGMQ